MYAMHLGEAGPGDAAAIAALRRSVADDLTHRFGRGHWSTAVSEAGVRFGMRHARVLVARSSGEILGALTLAKRRPWAIDPDYFTAVSAPIYLTGLAVAPAYQGKGVGRWLVDQAAIVARAWPADAIRLDAYDAEAGGGGFYTRVGFKEVGRVTYRGSPLIYYEQLLGAA
jgi:GNAT superfamily N-acetyltransferase